MAEPQVSPTILDVFCWTRFGTEAGEGIGEIVTRKETERADNDGIFYWGIGNAVGDAIRELLRRSSQPQVLFSPMRGRRPRIVDAAPQRVLRWTIGERLDGSRYPLPPTINITSHGESSAGRPHYALVCASDVPLALGSFGSLDLRSLVNLISGKPVGASQVTAVVRNLGEHQGGAYRVAMRARLATPYFVRLHEPVAVVG